MKKSILPVVAMCSISLWLLSCNGGPTSYSLKADDSFDKLSPKEKLAEIKRHEIPTDKNPANEEWQKNVYRNNKYHFRIQLPEGWEFDAGTAKNTLARALNREAAAVIAVSVTEGIASSNDIQKEISEEDFKKIMNELFSLQNTKITGMELEKGYLANFPAYIVNSYSIQSAGSKSYEYVSKQISCYNEGNSYIITINLPISEWSGTMSRTFDRVVESFHFELL